MVSFSSAGGAAVVLSLRFPAAFEVVSINAIQPVPSFATSRARKRILPPSVVWALSSGICRSAVLPARSTNWFRPVVAPARLLLPRNVPRCLLHSRAAALNQNHQNNHCHGSGNDSDNHGAIHTFSPSCPFLSLLFPAGQRTE